MDENAAKTERECTELLNYPFSESDNLLSTLAPSGWQNSPYIRFFHPTAAQQLEEYNRIHKNLSGLLKKKEEKISEPAKTIADFEQDDVTSVNMKKEFILVLGLAIYDIFSTNHEVIASDGKIYDLGSFRGSGGFIAEFINEHFKEHSGNYDYMDFYMGTIWIHSRADLLPFYEYIFDKLKRKNCGWKYSFPRMYLFDFKNLREDTKAENPEQYKPEEAALKEIEEAENEKQEQKLRDELDESYHKAFEEAKHQPPPPVVQAHKNIFGFFPDGFPTEDL